MEIDNLRVESSNNAPVVRINKAQRDELDVKVGDKVLVKRTKTEVVEAEVHQALRGEIEDVVLVGGEFEEKEPKLEIVKDEEVEGDSTDSEEEFEDETEDDEYEDE